MSWRDWWGWRGRGGRGLPAAVTAADNRKFFTWALSYAWISIIPRGIRSNILRAALDFTIANHTPDRTSPPPNPSTSRI